MTKSMDKLQCPMIKVRIGTQDHDHADRGQD